MEEDKTDQELWEPAYIKYMLLARKKGRNLIFYQYKYTPFMFYRQVVVLEQLNIREIVFCVILSSETLQKKNPKHQQNEQNVIITTLSMLHIRVHNTYIIYVYMQCCLRCGL